MNPLNLERPYLIQEPVEKLVAVFPNALFNYICRSLLGKVNLFRMDLDFI